MPSLRDALGIPSTQAPITLAAFGSYVVPLLVSYVAMAMLAITPQTRAFRVALWPIVTLLAFRAGHLDVSFGKPEFKFFNGELVRFMMCAIAHSLSWALATKPLVRHLRPTNSSPSTIMDALDLVTNLRGIGWDWSRGLYVPRDTRPIHRIGFAVYTLLSLVAHFFLCSVFHQVVQTFSAGNRSSSQPRSIFDDTLPFALCYLRASLISVVATLMAYAGTQMNYELATLVGVLVVRQDPAQWPPAYAHPMRATSLSALWARRWHQTLRHTLRVCAAPFDRVLGRAAAVTAAFLASGLVHHVILLTYDTRADAWRMLIGFGMMAPGVLAERAYYKATGRKVGGVRGWVWTMAWMILWGNVIIDGLMRAGMYAQPNAVSSESPLWRMVNDGVVKFDAWLHGV